MSRESIETVRCATEAYLRDPEALLKYALVPGRCWAMHRLRGLFVIGALAVVVGAVAAGPAAAAKGGNNDTAKLCQKGGWNTLVSHSGDSFANVGDCVNDGAHGLGVQPAPLDADRVRGAHRRHIHGR